VQRLREKIELKASLAYVGGRKALSADGKYYKADMRNIWDTRLGIGYNINNNLSASLEAANLASQQYDLWLGYPAQRIRVMLSLLYKF
jgi:outer membrane receptor protein involved in Fe transport